ncbi:MAG: hypothetical protein DHS20C15_13380 [Planctomycetota bacterium]|nr:MAG: hypothetical protein DHS20C15_13380 [Planctomycetota bacterium]
MPFLAKLVSVLFFSAPLYAQLTDLQPGRNFPQAVNAFGVKRSENIDVADIDNDGDYDVGVANGGDGAAAGNELYLNQGGASGGTLGEFVRVTTTHWAEHTIDTSRDIEFVDFESDGDLDVFITNRGVVTNGGEVSRAYSNRGGLQKGTIGALRDSTDSFWGTLVSVPPTDEVGTADGSGPFRNFSCDCDFADLDDDGHLDLFFSSYGPNINGTRDSRIFLNNGAGTFDEHWPWVEPGADIRIHTLDVELVDLDGDFDIDLFGSSRDSQSRVYRNNLYASPGTTALFTDMTQSALIDTGAGLNGSNTYETEFGDVDGDGDFDLWMLNYDGGGGGNLDRILANNGDFTFTKRSDWIDSDPDVDENEIDFFDFDSDGDLDTFVANYLGVNWIYTNSLLNGGASPALFHRNGQAGSLATWPELPASGNSNQSLDADLADMDNDGDPDILLSNENQDNRYYENVLGVPDTFAPTFQLLSVQLDKDDGSDTVIHAQIRDNAPFYVTAFYDAKLFYSVSGGQERCVRMASQGSMQFRAVIPGEHVGTIAYRVEVTDDNGNTGVSSTTMYAQSGGTPGGWQSLSCGTLGTNGIPQLEGSGELTGGTPTRYVLRGAAPSAFAVLFVSLSSTPAPFKQGTLYPFPALSLLTRVTDAGGLDHVSFTWPGIGLLPSGSTLFAQYGVNDAAHPSGASLSNGVLATVP